MKMIKKIFAFVLSGFMLMQTVYAERISSWAEKDYIKMSTHAFLDEELLSGNITDNITRLEFCHIVMKIFESENYIQINEGDNVFTDTNDEYSVMAYKAGIVNGKGGNLFAPYDTITRQEMAVMISRLISTFPVRFIKDKNQIKSYKMRFCDFSDTADWAMDDMACLCFYDIIGGIGENTVAPLSVATKEQAICMLKRVCENFDIFKDSYQQPKVSATINSDLKNATISWEYPGSVKYFALIIKDSDGGEDRVNLKAGKFVVDNYEIDCSKKYTVYVCAVLKDGNKILSLPCEFEKPVESTPVIQPDITEQREIQKPQQPNEQVQQSEQPSEPQNEIIQQEQKPVSENINVQLSVTDKEQRVFPNGYYFQNKEEAEEYMTDVAVPVWVLCSDGSKKSSKRTITVNRALADDVVKIFTEIYEDSSQFPIKDVGGYYWRDTAYGKISQHSYGTCIDINYNENYYVTPEGVAVTGSYWKPGEDPYSIPEDSIVVKTFAKYGWLWGGNCWGAKYNRDYMHFTYLGK